MIEISFHGSGYIQLADSLLVNTEFVVEDWNTFEYEFVRRWKQHGQQASDVHNADRHRTPDI